MADSDCRRCDPHLHRFRLWWSIFNRPIHALLPDQPWWFSPPYTTFSTALVFLGLSAAFGGPWVERRGPRAAATAAALLFGSGLILGGIGLAVKQSVLVFLGMGVIGGMGCGLGYIAPVSTLVKWFPDRRGMATGMAIMGFGGGAFLAGYLNLSLMNALGVANSIMALGAMYFCLMMIGARIIRRPPAGWKPEGWTPSVQKNKMITDRSITRNKAIRTVQFYLLWGILFINVTAGIGILAQASPMMQDMFLKTPLAGRRRSFVHQPVQRRRAGSSGPHLSDYIGRRNTYVIFFLTQVGLFLLIPNWPRVAIGSHSRRRSSSIFSMYGGGFATIPAFLADMFGPENVGAIHGALLTAWSAAAIAGPVIITELLLAPGRAWRPAPARSTSTTIRYRSWRHYWRSASCWRSSCGRSATRIRGCAASMTNSWSPSGRESDSRCKSLA